MNNKSMYMLFGFLAMVLLLLESRDIRFVEIFGRTILCGGALYYVFHSYQKKREVTIMMALMAALGLVYNPIYEPRIPNVAWVVIDIIAIALFYTISTRTPIEEPIGRHREEEEHNL